MSSIDDLFKKPAMPGDKRKLETARDPNETYKAAKLAANGYASSNGRTAAVADEEDDAIEAGPSMPPEDDESYGPDVPDDEEGRFFGGGTTSQENQILDYMEDQEPAEIAPETIDAAWLRRMAVNFEKRITKNAELRAKFENEPQKFIGSEADLDTDIKALSILAEHPHLFGEFARLGCVGSLVQLLAHENTDVAIDVVEILSELTDEDVTAEVEQWNDLVDAMIEADLLGLLVSNLERLDEGNEVDRSGVYHSLSVVENLASRLSLAEQVFGETTLLRWLLERTKRREKQVTQNKQYAVEVLAILLQSSKKNRSKFCRINDVESDSGKVNAVDYILQVLSTYRKKDPEKGTEEEEYVENIFDCITCIVDEPEGKRQFLEAEGVELCCIMISQGKLSKNRALRLLDHALGGSTGADVCGRFVEAAGLKTIFGLFMKRKQDGLSTEHLLGIFASLLRSLPANSEARIRTLVKFVEKDYEKVGRLIELRRIYAARVAAVDQTIADERRRLDVATEQDMTGEWLSRRLDAGLYCLQIIDVILAWLVAEDDGAREKIRALLVERDESLRTVRATIQEQLDGLADRDGNAGAAPVEADEDENEDERSMKEMLTALLPFVE